MNMWGGEYNCGGGRDEKDSGGVGCKHYLSDEQCHPIDVVSTFNLARKLRLECINIFKQCTLLPFLTYLQSFVLPFLTSFQPLNLPFLTSLHLCKHSFLISLQLFNLPVLKSLHPLNLPFLASFQVYSFWAL